MIPQIPETLYKVFTSRWLEASGAPADAEDWCRKGYLLEVAQGKVPGYAVAPAAYEWIVDGPCLTGLR